MKQRRFFVIWPFFVVGITVSSLYLIPHFAVKVQENAVVGKMLDTSRFEYEPPFLSVSNHNPIWITDKMQLAQILTEGAPEIAGYIPKTEPKSDVLLHNIKRELEHLMENGILPIENYQLDGSPVPLLYTDEKQQSVLVWDVSCSSSTGTAIELIYHSATGKYVSLRYANAAAVQEITSDYCVGFSQYWDSDVWISNTIPCRNDYNAPLIFSLDVIENGYALTMFYEDT